MGQEDRDWYRQRTARGNSADDGDLFPNHRWTTVRSTLFPTALAVLAVLALLVLGLRQGWFDRDGRSHAASAEAEIAALRAWESDRPPSVRTPHAAPLVQPTFHERYPEPIELTLLSFAILSPFVLLGFLVALFIRRLRAAALIGLLLGPAAATASGHLYTRGLWFRWGVLYPADSMGAVFQFFEVIAASFAIAAIAGAIAVLTLGKAYRLRERGRPAPGTTAT